MPESAYPEAMSSLTERVNCYARRVQEVVLKGIEHPTYELKRSATISRDNLADRLDFLKLFQGLANSHKSDECLIVIGADQKERRFFAIENADDFDPAKLSPIIAKYLSPEPLYEVFNAMRSSSGERYVLIVMDRAQPRPILTLVDGKTDLKTHFRPGDIWIKHNTGLRAATKADLDQMYEPYVEKEATKRARVIFDHLKQDLGPELLSQAVTSAPVPELLLGSRERLVRFAAAMISSIDRTRFNTLIEMARDTLVVRWGQLLEGSANQYGIDPREKANLSSFYYTQFMPTLQSVIDLGVLVIKFDGLCEWLGLLMKLLLDAFATSSHLEQLRAMSAGDVFIKPMAVQDAYSDVESDVEDEFTPLALGRSAYEIYLGARIWATYAVCRDRLGFLKSLLPCFVKIVGGRSYPPSTEPILFYPFSGDLGLPPMVKGRNEDYWQERVKEGWEDVFGSKSKFLDAAAELELILEFNSYFLLRYQSEEMTTFRTSHPEKSFEYMPDFWRSSLQPCMPMAEFIYESMVSTKGFPLELAVEPELMAATFKNAGELQRKCFFAEVLESLRRWQADVMIQRRMFAPDVDWPPRLSAAIGEYRKYLEQRLT